MVELIELETDVLDGELQQVPETSQVLGCGPRVSIHILTKRGKKDIKIKNWKNGANQAIFRKSLSANRFTEIKKRSWRVKGKKKVPWARINPGKLQFTVSALCYQTSKAPR